VVTQNAIIEPPVKGDSASSSDRTECLFGWGRYAKTLNDRFWREAAIRRPRRIGRKPA